MITPLFIFSLPRSGSTLLQRVLMGHSKVASVAEPSLMLPFAYARKAAGVAAEYSHLNSCAAIEDFVEKLPNKDATYDDALRDFLIRLYSAQCSGGEEYFLDKTPRYYYIISEIARLFPKAKFIFLFRNPLQQLASIVNTFGKGRFNALHVSYDDLYLGPILLSEGYQLLQGRAIAVNYEKFVASPETETQIICAFLGLEYETEMVQDFSRQEPEGRMGDPSGTLEYSTISTLPTTKWEDFVSNKYRKRLALNYLKELPENVLSIQGYNKSELIKTVQEVDAGLNGVCRDIIDYNYAWLVRLSKANLFFGKTIGSWAKHKYLS